MTKIEKIKDLHEFFINKFRPRKKVILQFYKMVFHGSYHYINNKHYITLNKKDNYSTLCDSCAHEWSHLLEKNKYVKEHHSDSWGKNFARVYRAYLEWLEIQS